MTIPANRTLNDIAHEMCVVFNGCPERFNWRAAVGGSRRYPDVRFTTRTSMVAVTYSPYRQEFTVTFSRTACAWGDYLSGAYRSLATITSCLKACGLEFSTAVSEDTVLRVEYHPVHKSCTVHLALHDDDWNSFKVPEEIIE